MLSLPLEGKNTQTCSNPWDVPAQESPLETQHPGFLLDAGPVGTLPGMYQNISLVEGKQIFSIHLVCAV